MKTKLSDIIQGEKIYILCANEYPHYAYLDSALAHADCDAFNANARKRALKDKSGSSVYWHVHRVPFNTAR